MEIILRGPLDIACRGHFYVSLGVHGLKRSYLSYLHCLLHHWNAEMRLAFYGWLAKLRPHAAGMNERRRSGEKVLASRTKVEVRWRLQVVRMFVAASYNWVLRNVLHEIAWAGLRNLGRT